jgi:hypothetical protein
MNAFEILQGKPLGLGGVPFGNGCANPQQVLADYTSLKTGISQAFWSDLRSEELIENGAAVPPEN